MGAQVPSRRVFLLRAFALTAAVSAAGVVLMALYLAALLRLPPEQGSAFVRVVAVAFAALSLAVNLVNRRLYAPVLAFLEGHPRGAVDAALARAAYRRAAGLPGLTFALGEAWWLLGGVAVAAATALASPGLSLEAGLVMVAAAASGGLVVMIFHYFLFKRMLAPVRAALARSVGDPDARAALGVRVSVRAKLLASLCGVTGVVVVFTLLLADSLARRPLETILAAAPRAVAVELAERGGIEEAALAAVEERVRRLAAEAARSELRAQRAVSVAVLLLGGLLAVGVAVVVSRDVADAARALARGAERIAAGDLREAVACEGEDELGALALAFERMTAALRGTVGSVAAAADEVDRAASRLAGVAADVAAATTAQVSGIERAANGMAEVRVQVEEITGAARSLNQSVDESGGAIAELGSAGEQLHGSAAALSEKSAAVSGSIGRMVESVRRVVASADDLARAADETASGVEGMAAAMGQVDASAAETARLSERVTQVAELGRERVQQTVSGIEAIRRASADVEGVIHDLGGRVESIGAILGVIDDVADETSLLALNAAIIAAQAGDRGRAFSVVADEIKALADRVLENTHEIGTTIRGVQEESEKAARAMERGAELVLRGAEVAGEAGVALEEITRAARSSGEHLHGIVAAVKEQAAASGRIVGLMERVRAGVDQIRSSGAQQEQGHEVVRDSALALRGVAEHVEQSAREQARGAAGIARSVDRVRDAAAEIRAALEQQSRASAAADDRLAEVHARTRSHEQSATTLAEATAGLAAQARALRESIRRFAL